MEIVKTIWTSTFIGLLLWVKDSYTLNSEELHLFQPVRIADKSNKQITRVLKKPDKDAIFLIETMFGQRQTACHDGDYIRFYEGNSSNGLLRYEENCVLSNKTIVSDSEMVFIDVQSPATEVWTLVAKAQANEGCLDTPVHLVASGEEQFITSANFPNLYPAMVNCKWSITSPNKRNIVTTIYYMDVEVGPTDKCVFDFIQLESDNKTETFCGKNNWTEVKRTGAEFVIEFKSDFSGRRHGFLIGYHEQTDTNLIKQDL